MTRYEGEKITGVSASSAFDVELVRSDQTKAVVEINEELEESIQFSLSNDGIVHISLLPREFRIFGRQQNRIMKLTVYLSELSYLQASGAVRISASGNFSAEHAEILLTGASELKSLDISARNIILNSSGAGKATLNATADTFSVNLSGAAEATLNIGCREMEILCSGGTDLDLTGSAEQANMTAAAASDIDASGFSVKQMEVAASGASNVRVWAEEQLEATASSASSIRYKGDPGSIHIRTFSAASVRAMSNIRQAVSVRHF